MPIMSNAVCRPAKWLSSTLASFDYTAPVTVPRRKLLLVELNEINWSVVDQLIAERGADFLPNFTRLRRDATWGAPQALERPPLLDPWITWVSVHTGVAHDVHGARILEQDAATVTAKRTWEYAADAGLRVGVFGSVGAYPPRPINGFVVPGPFAPGDDTYPPALQPVQRLNRLHTQAHGGSRARQSLAAMLATGLRLLRLGLRPATCLAVASQLLRERLDPARGWRRVILQPLVNFDFFAYQYRRVRPDFATWHSYHAAHFMHHYWRAWNDEHFATRGPPEEKVRYGEAVPLGYQVCDQLLGRFLDLIDDDTVLMICSSMGQQPYVNAAYRDGKVILRFKAIQDFLGRIGAVGVTEVVQTMVPQFNLRVPDRDQRQQLLQRLVGTRRVCVDDATAGFAVEETGEILTVTPLGMPERRTDVAYEVPGTPEPIPFADAFVMDAPTVKQGMHHPDGLLIIHGRGVPRGKRLETCDNLDLAPTLLSILGITPPSSMTGRALVHLA